MGDFHCPKCKPFSAVDCDGSCAVSLFECPRCYREYPTEWPHLFGTNGIKAKAIIEQENPLVTAIIVGEHGAVTMDWCCNRVWVWVDKNGNVRKALHIAN